MNEVFVVLLSISIAWGEATHYEDVVLADFNNFPTEEDCLDYARDTLPGRTWGIAEQFEGADVTVSATCSRVPE